MFSTKLSVSVHILCMVALRSSPAVTSEHIAESICTNPALVRRLMSRLRRAQLIRTCQKRGAVGLGRPADEISLRDVFFAVEPERRLFDLHTGTNTRCPVGAHIGEVMTDIYERVQTGFDSQLQSIRLSDILDKLKERGVT